jgi:hypothetical protein
VSDDDELMRTNIHALRRIPTHGLSMQAIKAYTSDCAATETGSGVSASLQLYKYTDTLRTSDSTLICHLQFSVNVSSKH